MTHHTIDGLVLSIHATAREAKGGISGIARRRGMAEQQLINRLNSNDFTKLPNIGDLVAVLDEGDLSPLDYICAMYQGRLVTRSALKAKTIIQAVIHAANEHADILQAYEKFTRDGFLDEEERLALRKEITEARDALTELENTVMDGRQ